MFKETPADIAMDIGSDVTLSCAAQGVPEPKIKWRKLNITSTSSKPLIYNQKAGTLQINSKSILRDVTNKHEAQQQNGMGPHSAVVTIHKSSGH